MSKKQEQTQNNTLSEQHEILDGLAQVFRVARDGIVGNSLKQRNFTKQTTSQLSKKHI